MKNLQTLFYSCCAIFTFPSAMYEGSDYYKYLPEFIFYFVGFFFFLNYNLLGVKQYLTVFLMYFFLIISDVEHLFMCLLAICVTYLEKCLSKSLAHFLGGCRPLCCWVASYFKRKWTEGGFSCGKCPFSRLEW